MVLLTRDCAAALECVEHYHRERHHQGIENRLIGTVAENEDATEPVVRESRLGGLLNHYRRAA